jgi:membrane protease YdiL (CAAX protease family)
VAHRSDYQLNEEISWSIKEVVLGIFTFFVVNIFIWIFPAIYYMISSEVPVLPDEKNFVRVNLLFNLLTQLSMLFVVWVFTIRRDKNALSQMGFYKLGPKNILLKIVLFGIFQTIIISILYSILLDALQSDVLEITELTTYIIGDGWLSIVFIIVAVIVAPFSEELFFRGFLYLGLRTRFGVIPGSIVSSLLFGAAHIAPGNAIITFVIGLILVNIYQRTGTIWSSIMVHSGFNSISVMVAILTL